MGNKSTKSSQRRPSEEETVTGLLPTEGLEPQNYDIENLVFANCGAEGLSYAGAMSVFEKLGLLQRIKRFSGVGTGAVVAAFLAIGLDSKEFQAAFNEYLVNVQADDEIGYENFFEKFTVDYGWNSGTKFFDWFSQLLESKSFDSDLTFMQLYEETDKELCLSVTNVDKLTLEYCHPKTTPDLAIKQAVFMAISIPGVFVPTKYGPADDKCLYVNGTLLCNYPIHCFDGWLLSMDDANSFLNRLESPENFYLPRVFDSKNAKTLGLFPIDKQQETRYKDFVERLASANEEMKIPPTTLGLGYMAASQNRSALAHKFTLLRKTCSTLLLIAEDLEDYEGNISLDAFTNKVFIDNSLTKTDRLLFPEIGQTHQDLNDFLLTFSESEWTFSRLRLKLFIQKKLLGLLHQYSDYYKTDITSLQSYFATLFDVGSSTTNLSESDYDRTVGILCEYIGTQDVDFEDYDQTFLYRQGWNATVSYFRDFTKQTDESQLSETEIS